MLSFRLKCHKPPPLTFMLHLGSQVVVLLIDSISADDASQIAETYRSKQIPVFVVYMGSRGDARYLESIATSNDTIIYVPDGVISLHSVVRELTTKLCQTVQEGKMKSTLSQIFLCRVLFQSTCGEAVLTARSLNQPTLVTSMYKQYWYLSRINNTFLVCLRQWFSNFFLCDAFGKVCRACDAPEIRR